MARPDFVCARGNDAPAVTAEVAQLREDTDPTSDHVIVLNMR